MGLKWIEDRPDHDNLHPTYVQFGQVEAMVTRGFYCGCGCRTIKQLQRWFTRFEYATLRRLGYHSVAMWASRIVAESSIQLVFERKSQLNIGAIPFDLW